MVANPDKFQAIFPGTESENISIMVGQNKIVGTKEVKLLRVWIDSQLTFYPHILNICKKASAKTKALMRIRSYLSQKQADFLFNAFIMSSFDYCPLVWMFCSKQAHNLVTSTHHKALSAKFSLFNMSYDQIL